MLLKCCCARIQDVYDGAGFDLSRASLIHSAGIAAHVSQVDTLESKRARIRTRGQPAMDQRIFPGCLRFEMANCTLESSPGRGSAQFNGQRKIYVASAREARSVAGLKRGKPITIISCVASWI